MNFALQIVLKTSLILMSAGVLSILIKRSSAALRHAVWILALIAVLAFPVASALLPPIELAIFPEPEPVLSAIAVGPSAAQQTFSPLVPGTEPATVESAPETPILEPWSWMEWFFGIWAAGALLVLLSWFRALLELRRLKNSSCVVQCELLEDVQREFGVKSGVQLRVSSESVPPMTWGVFGHVILLPASVNDWTSVRRRLVLEHEMAHVKRRDGLGQALSQVVCSLYWFNPLVWYAARRLHEECERACDDAVLRLGVDAADYADHLVDIARGLNSGFARTAFSMAHPSQLKSRVLAILDAGIRRRRLSLRAGMTLATVGVLILSTAAIRLTAVAGLALPMFPFPVFPMPVPEPPGAQQEVQISPLPSGDASIEGRVLSSAENNPVRGARVILNTDPVSESAVVTIADENGRFEFPKIAAGKYQLLATNDGYVRGMYGQRSLNGPAEPILLAAGQSLKSLNVSLTPMGAISGRIRNRFGEPAGNVAVRALRIVYQNGRKTLLPFQTARTNDLGDYRLYYLEPGQYFVTALPFEGPTPEPTNGLARLVILPGSPFGTASPSTVMTSAANFSTQGLMSAAETGETYVPLYFPGVADWSAATAIDLKPGVTYTSADFVVSEVRAAQIRGQVRDAAGQPVMGAAGVLAIQGDAPASGDRYGSVRDDGTLEFKGIAPGAYDLVVSSGNLPAGVLTTVPAGIGGAVIDRGAAVAAGAANDARLQARTPLRVISADIENLSLTLRPGFRIDGKIVFEGLPTADMAGLAVQLVPSSPLPYETSSTAISLQRSRSFSMPGLVGTDGTFSITGAFPGVYRIAIRGASKLPPGAHIKSARIEGKDVLSPRFVLETEPRGELEIVIGSNPGTLQATAIDDKKAPAKAATLVLIPDSERSQRYELYLKVVTDGEGKARLENVPPEPIRLSCGRRSTTAPGGTPKSCGNTKGWGNSCRSAPVLQSMWN